MLLAVATFALARLHYPVLVARNADALPLGLSPAELVTAQSLRMTVVVLLCALAGLFWKDRARLPGLGAWPGLHRAAGLAGVGLAAAVVTSLVHDIPQRALTPGIYPGSPGEALRMYPMNPLVDEVIGRMGFLTLLAGLTRRPRVAIALHAVVMTGLATFAHQRLTGWPDGWDGPMLTGIACGLVVHAGLGEIYRRHGLAGAVIAHAGLQAKLFWLAG